MNYMEYTSINTYYSCSVVPFNSMFQFHSSVTPPTVHSYYTHHIKHETEIPYVQLPARWFIYILRVTQFNRNVNQLSSTFKRCFMNTNQYCSDTTHIAHHPVVSVCENESNICIYLLIISLFVGQIKDIHNGDDLVRLIRQHIYIYCRYLSTSLWSFVRKRVYKRSTHV